MLAARHDDDDDKWIGLSNIFAVIFLNSRSYARNLSGI